MFDTLSSRNVLTNMVTVHEMRQDEQEAAREHDETQDEEEGDTTESERLQPRPEHNRLERREKLENEERKQNEKEDKKGDEEEADFAYVRAAYGTGKLADIPRAVWQLLRNLRYFILCLGICAIMFNVIGLSMFIPKMLELKHRVSQTSASLLIGSQVPPASLGIVCGGLIYKRARFTRRGTLLFCHACLCVICLSFISFFYLDCPNSRLASPPPAAPPSSSLSPNNKVNLNNSVTRSLLCSACVSHPICVSAGKSGFDWSPLCDPLTGLSYANPCAAGCLASPQPIKSHSASSSSFSSAVITPTSTTTHSSAFTSSTNQMAISSGKSECACTKTRLHSDLIGGLCNPGCGSKLVPFMLVLTLVMFTIGAMQNPLTMTTLRIVRQEQRPLALGVQFVILRALAYLSSPATYGHVIDGNCAAWSWRCGARKNCLLSDVRGMNRDISALALGMKLAAFALLALLFFLLPREPLREPRRQSSCRESGRRRQSAETTTRKA